MNNYYGIYEDQLYRYNTGAEHRCFSFLGAHPMEWEGEEGVRFAVWAPGVKSVCVVGDFNGWTRQGHYLDPLGSSGVWAGFIKDAKPGMLYKYCVCTQWGEDIYKADPVGFSAEVRPNTASRVADLSYDWGDRAWMEERARSNHFEKPLNIYEVHLGSWKQHEGPPRANEQEVPRECFYTYRELAGSLLPYVKDMGYSHIELLPIMEHPLDASWGYQTVGYYAATSRFGAPTDLMYFIDRCHQEGIGVILDWVPGHFCRDQHGLGRFNGDKLYEDMDHPQWGTYEFDFGRAEVRSFLLSNAVFWLELYHADGFRVDGVSSMLYLNFGLEGEAANRRNREGGDGNLEAISFLREFNRMVGEDFPGVMTIAEESSAWPLITRPPDQGGLGFHYKWDMGWMNDTLRYMQIDFPGRPFNHNLLTFSMMYAFSENFILPLSHDEVVHGKCSLITRMPGDYWRQFAGLRMLALYQYTHSGANLNFMGNEIGQFIEWRFYEGIEFFLAEKYEHHRQHQQFIRALNHVYLDEPALWQQNYAWEGFQWLDADNAGQGILLYVRKGKAEDDLLLVAVNFNTEGYDSFRVGVPEAGTWFERFTADEKDFGGSGVFLNPEPVRSEDVEAHGQKQSIVVKMPPMGGFILKYKKEDKSTPVNPDSKPV